MEFDKVLNIAHLSYLLMEEIRLTTWDEWNPEKDGIKYLSTGVGYIPSYHFNETPCFEDDVKQ